MGDDESARASLPSLAPSQSLDASSPQAKEEALSFFATAHALLLANHGHLTSLTARQAVDSLQPVFGLNMLPGFDRESSAQCVGRFTEAQMYVRHALGALGVSATAPRDGLRVVSRMETVFDGLFDLAALAQQESNLRQNLRFGNEVREAYDAVRLSDPVLAHRTQALASFDLDTGEKGVGRFFDYASPVVGSPRFWSKDKVFVCVGVPLLAAIAFVMGWFFYG